MSSYFIFLGPSNNAYIWKLAFLINVAQDSGVKSKVSRLQHVRNFLLYLVLMYMFTPFFREPG
jgi:hypothetical protein